MAKTSISDEKIKEYIINGINEGASYILNKTNFYEHLRTIHRIEKQRCLRLYDKYYSEAQYRRNEESERVGVALGNEAVKTAIMSKLERLVGLEKRLKHIETMLESGMKKEVPLDTYEITALTKAYKDLSAEISKIEGDYAAQKQDVTVKSGVTGFILEE